MACPTAYYVVLACILSYVMALGHMTILDEATPCKFLLTMAMHSKLVSSWCLCISVM
jgi:hypothetical protein